MLIGMRFGEEETEVAVPMASISEWIGKQIDLVGAVGDLMPAPPDGMPRIIPPDVAYVTAPIRVSLNRSESEPILVLDFGPAVFGFRIDRQTIHHVLESLQKHFPIRRD